MDPGTGAPLDLRKVRYFVAVAQELHFGRAAERLYIAQPVLSRQIRKLEEELGAELLTRTSRHVALTPAGVKLLDEGRTLLAAAELAQRRIADIARRQASLTIAFFVGEDFTAAHTAFSISHPDVAINLEDPVIIDRGTTPSWQAFTSVDPRPDGRQPQPGPAVNNLAETLLHVASARAISFLPKSMAHAYGQPGIVFLPVIDIPPTRAGLAWTAANPSPLITAFAQCVNAGHRPTNEPPRP